MYKIGLNKTDNTYLFCILLFIMNMYQINTNYFIKINFLSLYIDILYLISNKTFILGYFCTFTFNIK